MRRDYPDLAAAFDAVESRCDFDALKKLVIAATVSDADMADYASALLGVLVLRWEHNAD